MLRNYLQIGCLGKASGVSADIGHISCLCIGDADQSKDQGVRVDQTFTTEYVEDRD